MKDEEDAGSGWFEVEAGSSSLTHWVGVPGLLAGTVLSTAATKGELLDWKPERESARAWESSLGSRVKGLRSGRSYFSTSLTWSMPTRWARRR